MLLATLGELVGPLQVVHLIDEHLDGRGVHIELLEDGEGLLVQLITDSNVRNIRSIVVV